MMDRRIIKTKIAIRSAYFELLKEKKDRRITVAELTRLANIDRKTFYLHYTCVEDILKDFCDEKVQELLNRLQDTGFYKDPLQLNIIFDILNDIINADIDYYRLLNSQNYQFFWDRIHTIMVDALIAVYASKVTVTKVEMRVYCNFFISGMIQVYQEHLHNPDILTSEQLGNIILNIARQGVSHLFID